MSIVKAHPLGRQDFDCAVIGGGPGGLVAALYLARYQRRVLLVSAGKPRALWIPRTHNLIGYDRGITGNLLLKRLSRQAIRCGVERVEGWAELTRASRKGFELRVRDQVYFVPHVILATGIEDLQPSGIPNLTELRKDGLLRYCPICDGFEFRAKKIAVLAQDERGARSSLFISDYARSVDVVVPESLKLSSRLLSQIEGRGIRIQRGQPKAIQKVSSPRGLVIQLSRNETLRCDVAYIEMGSRLRDEAFRKIRGIKLSEDDRIVTDTNQETSLPGLYAVGDCVESLAQISVAAGQGAVAATHVHNRLRARGRSIVRSGNKD